MASTRASTGNSRPRIHNPISTAPERKRRATTTTTTAGGGGTSTKKRGAPKKSASAATTTTTTTGAGVRKRGRPPLHHKRKPHLSDKVEGAVEKAVGAVTRRPGRKAAGTRKMRGTDGKGSRRRA
ncbi:hypothetical protein F4809DRAFT_595744 [Biscogniauxia mediterranea]|nr:hypothetical protein F4809DRAFT_595744 [Biscogniauxia mediterranea]